ncbi:MAG: hypothetical protein R2825_03230 [Saprospiraceae bacterium]
MLFKPVPKLSGQVSLNGFVSMDRLFQTFSFRCKVRYSNFIKAFFRNESPFGLGCFLNIDGPSTALVVYIIRRTAQLKPKRKR